MLKEDQLLNTSKFRGQPLKKRHKFVVFGLERANLATLGGTVTSMRFSMLLYRAVPSLSDPSCQVVLTGARETAAGG